MNHSSTLQWLAEMDTSKLLEILKDFTTQEDVKPLFRDYLEDLYSDSQDS